MLRRYGDLTRVALARYLAPREPHRHLYALVADYPRRGGRMMRPTLCIATARLFGAAAEEAAGAAVGLELLHNAFLVHDDVEDESEARRGGPTLHATHGTAVAVNTGDALILLGLRALMDTRATIGPRLALRLLEDAERMGRESVEGQAMELGWRRDVALRLGDAEYFAMVLKKTCWYTTIFPSRAGALIGTRSEENLDRFIRFGFFLGVAFQIQDDVLNLVGNEAAYGKELDGDIREGKRTLMLLHLMREAGDAERDRLAAFLALPRAARDDEDVRWVRDRMLARGSVDYARTVAHALAGAAREECVRLYAGMPDSEDRRFVEELPAWVIRRA
ncbi:MAG: polyprenyl synthetase family protein [Deltaproteobacteria bacterium]|nr:polyprenyl synthetase family protein [Deltaproteobacteria bacterium]